MILLLLQKTLEFSNRLMEIQTVELCQIKPDHKVLEVGFGPGVGLQAAYRYIKGQKLVFIKIILVYFYCNIATLSFALSIQLSS